MKEACAKLCLILATLMALTTVVCVVAAIWSSPDAATFSRLFFIKVLYSTLFACWTFLAGWFVLES